MSCTTIARADVFACFACNCACVLETCVWAEKSIKSSDFKKYAGRGMEKRTSTCESSQLALNFSCDTSWPSIKGCKCLDATF